MTPRSTPLTQAHQALGARMIGFAGFSMPVQYSSILAEHEAVRTAAGLFDVSHMGEIAVEGPDALAVVDALVSNDLTRCADGQAMYAGLLNDAGGFVDDVVVYRRAADRLLVCVNASNRDKDFAWMKERARGAAQLSDRGDELAQLALQGPKARQILSTLTILPIGQLARYRFLEGEVAGTECLVASTGYTGEDGFELFCDAGAAERLWSALLEAGRPSGLVPAGLGARDTLRTEMKYPLYGQDIDAQHTPLEASLGWIAKLEKRHFIGKEALVRQRAEGVKRRLVGFEVVGQGIPRTGMRILHAGAPVGVVTSGTFGPSVKKAIGIGYVPTERAATGTPLEIQIRERAVAAVVVDTPFYRAR